MSVISHEKQERIKEEILRVLFENSPRALFTSDISSSIIRDEEFTLKLLESLYSKKIINRITKNSDGKDYLSRKRWILTPKTYKTYKTLINDQR